jgi:multiple sugar transport system permease protein
MRQRQNLPGYLFSLPAIAFMVVFVGYPIVSNFILSFQNVNVMTFSQPDHPWVGWETYKNLFEDPLTWTALSNTTVFTVACIVVQFTLGFLLALLFQKKFFGSPTIRGLLVITWMLPITITALVFKFMLSPGDGVFDYILMQWGILAKPVGWLINPNTALLGVIVTNIWVGIPFNMIILSTALSTVPQQLYESARVDGASGLQAFTAVTLPYLKGAILSVLVLGLIYTFKVFELIFVMTNGGPVNSTEVLSTVSYQHSFVEYNFSAGAATANVLFVILFAISLVYLNQVRKEEVL